MWQTFIFLGTTRLFATAAAPPTAHKGGLSAYSWTLGFERTAVLEGVTWRLTAVHISSASTPRLPVNTRCCQHVPSGNDGLGFRVSCAEEVCTAIRIDRIAKSTIYYVLCTCHTSWVQAPQGPLQALQAQENTSLTDKETAGARYGLSKAMR